MTFSIAISGITGYPTRDHRYDACLRFLKGAGKLEAQLGIKIGVYLADTSPPDIQAEFSGLATLVPCPDTSYTSKKIASLQAAVDSGATAIVITELEKDGLLVDLGRLCQPIFDDSADLVIPDRTPLSWASYPREMRETEGFALDQIAQFVGTRYDTMFGAFVMNRTLAPLFLSCQAKMWTWLHEPRLRFMKEHPDRVVGIPVNFLYPAAQKAAEEGNQAFHLKRLEQLDFSLIRPLKIIYGQ